MTTEVRPIGTANDESECPPNPRLSIRPYVGGLSVIVGLQAVGAVAGLLPILAVIELGRALLAPMPLEARHAWIVVAIGAGGLLVHLALTAASSAVGHMLDSKVQLAFRRTLAAHLARVPVGWVNQQRSGHLAKALGDDVGAVHPFVAHIPATLVSAFLIPLVSFVYLLTIDWRLALITLIPVPLALSFLPLVMTPARQTEQTEFDSGMERMANSAVEFVHGIAVVKAFGGSRRAHRAFLADVNSFVGSFARMVRGLAKPVAAMQLVLSPPFVIATVLIGGIMLIDRGLPPADILPFLLLGASFTAPVLVMVGHGLDDVQAAKRAVERLNEILDVAPQPEASTPTAPDGARLEFRDVRFSYDGHRDVLRGINVVLEAGSTTAVVGPSGSGKSTLAELIPRFFDPTGGGVSLGGVDLRNIATAELSRHIAFVFQDVRLLRASVRDNIALTAPDAELSDVISAARAASIHDRILELPNGYETVLGEEAELSGGEAQRLSVARALLSDCPIIVSMKRQRSPTP